MFPDINRRYTTTYYYYYFFVTLFIILAVFERICQIFCLNGNPFKKRNLKSDRVIIFTKIFVKLISRKNYYYPSNLHSSTHSQLKNTYCNVSNKSSNSRDAIETQLHTYVVGIWR